jgi:hypothetical protein
MGSVEIGPHGAAYSACSVSEAPALGPPRSSPGPLITEDCEDQGVRLESIVARLALAGVGVEARARWTFGLTPAFSQLGAPGPFTTLIAFMPGAVAEEMARSVQRLRGLGGHFRYPPTQIHMTVRNLDGVELGDLPNILSQVPPIKLRTARLHFTPETLLLQLAPTDRTLRSLRAQLDELPGARPLTRARSALAFANMLRLNGPVSNVLRIGVRHAGRELEGRPVEIHDLQLVSTDKIGSPDRTQMLGRYALAGTGPDHSPTSAHSAQPSDPR